MRDFVPAVGDIGLVRISGATGQAIRVGQWLLARVDNFRASRTVDVEDWADYQHAFVYLGNGQLIEAEPGGARIRPLSEYDGTTIYWCSNISAGLSDQQRQIIAFNAQTFLGTPYSFLDYVALTAHKLRVWLPGLRAYISSTHRMICSQLADRAYDLAGVHIFADGRDPGDVDPLDIFLRDKQLGRLIWPGPRAV